MNVLRVIVALEMIANQPDDAEIVVNLDLGLIRQRLGLA